jgi:hypothetical protein
VPTIAFVPCSRALNFGRGIDSATYKLQELVDCWCVVG